MSILIDTLAGNQYNKKCDITDQKIRRGTPLQEPRGKEEVFHE